METLFSVQGYKNSKVITYRKDFYHRLHQRVYRSLPTNLFHPYHYEMKGVVFFSKINRQSMGTGRYFLPAHNGGR